MTSDDNYVRQNCQARLVLYQLQLSMEHHVWVIIIAPGWGSVNLNQFTHHLPKIGYSSQEGRYGSLTTVEWSRPIFHLGPPFLPWWWWWDILQKTLFKIVEGEGDDEEWCPTSGTLWLLIQDVSLTAISPTWPLAKETTWQSPFYQHLSVHGLTLAFLLDFRRLCCASDKI